MNEPESFSSWADKVAEEVSQRSKKSYVCEGMWTPSGFFHIGNARPEIFTPYAVAKALESSGLNVRQNLVIDDFDAIKKIPAGLPPLDEKQFLGVPCALAPSPVKGFKSWSDYFSSNIREAVPHYGVKLHFLSAYQLYREGKFNDIISFSLDHAKEIVAVWSRVSGADKDERFFPLQVFCDSCRKIYYTNVTSWNGKTVSYTCTACNHSGKKSPFNGNAKLHWRVHWAAHWIALGVDFESGGKDHFSKGSSVDVGRALMREVFHAEPPVGVPTEFIQKKGKKISGSVGNAADLKQWLEVAEPELFRFMNFSYKPNSVVELDLGDNSFLLLYNRFEEAERIYYGVETARDEKLGQKIKREFELSAIESLPNKMPPQLPYAFASFVAQLYDPKTRSKEAVAVLQETGHLPPKLSAKDLQRVLQKLSRARHWIEHYAPEEFKMSFLETVSPEIRSQLSLQALAVFPEIAAAVQKQKTAEAIQTAVFELGKKNNIPLPELFQSLYFALIGKPRGPKIGSLVIALGKEKVAKRLKELAG